jgi:hypothetical protein
MAEKEGKKKEVTKVTMEDDREVEFAGTRSVLKEGVVILNDGAVVAFDTATDEQKKKGQLGVRMDFRDGGTRTYPIRRDMEQFHTLHGAKQKYGDELAGHKSDDPEDWRVTLDELHEQLYEKGDWYAERQPGQAGISVLIKALMEFNEKKGTPKTADQIRGFLKDKKPAEKEALKHTDRLRPIVQRLEEERRQKLAHVDTGKLLEELDAVAA